ncbi:MAG: hypothetical protein IPI88_19290 [Chitinophagaceae bacterium]|nr:hypothetical protein [Chitinophagaceae bacterium]
MSSLYSNSTGSGNIGVGTRSLFYNSTASYNVAVGDSALIDNIDGSSNTGIGPLQMYLPVTLPMLQLLARRLLLHKIIV